MLGLEFSIVMGGLLSIERDTSTQLFPVGMPWPWQGELHSSPVLAPVGSGLVRWEMSPYGRMGGLPSQFRMKIEDRSPSYVW